MGDTLTPGKKVQIPSTPFNLLIVINDTSYSLDITPMHNDIMNPMIIIRDAVKKEDTEGDKVIIEQLKKLEGMEAGK